MLNRLLQIVVITALLITTALVNATPVWAQTTLTIWGHAVHQQVAEGKRGGAEVNIAAEFEQQHGIKLQWETIAFSQMYDKILREINLSSSQADIVFVLSGWASPEVLNRFEPLDAYMAKVAIADFEDISPAMVRTYRLDGSQRAIPYRHNPQILHYNKEIFAARGIDKAPETFEELLEVAKQTTFQRDDGAQVYGFAADQVEDFAIVIRAFGGDVVTPDLKIRVNEPQAVKAIQALKALFDARAMPPNFASLKAAELQTLMSQGLVVMSIFGDNYFARFNDPEKSQVAGKTWFAPIPPSSESTSGHFPTAAGIWGMGIPKNGPADNRELAWKFMEFFARKDTQLKMAMNNNSPIRVSTYSDENYRKNVPYADVVQKVLPYASPSFPAFSGSKEAERIFLEQVNAAILGRIGVQQALDQAAAGIERVMKREGLL